MGRRQPLPSDAVPILHDGPLFHQLVVLDSDSGGDKNTKHDLHQHEEEILQQVRTLLLFPVVDDEASVESSSPFKNQWATLSVKTHRLWRTLSSVKSLKEQLHTLQAYKSTVIQYCKTIQSSSTDNTIQQVANKDDSDDDETGSSSPLIFLKATFRIMLEWSFSSQTPNTLRKALQSNLITIATVVDPAVSTRSSKPSVQTGLAVVEMYQQVIKSMIMSSERNCYWSQPLTCLSEAMSFTATRQIIAQDGRLTCDILEYLIQCRSSKTATNMTLPLPVLSGHQDQHGLTEVQETDQDNPSQPETAQLPQTAPTSIQMMDPLTAHSIQQGIQIAGIVQTLLLPLASSSYLGVDVAMDPTSNAAAIPSNSKAPQQWLGSLVTEIQAMLEKLLSQISLLSSSSVEGLSVVGIAYGRVLLVRWITSNTNPTDDNQARDDDDDNNLAQWACATLQDFLEFQHHWSSPIRLAVVQGLAATLPLDVLAIDATTIPTSTKTQDLQEGKAPLIPSVPSRPLLLLDLLSTFFLKQVRSAPDTAVRLTALKGLNTLSSRCSTLLTQGTSEERHASTVYHYIPVLVNDAIQIVLQAWENPAGRQVASYVPVLFQSLIGLLQQWEATPPPSTEVACDYENSSTTSNRSSLLQDLVRRVLTLPSNRKGRYLALEALLPLIPTYQLFTLGSCSNDGSPARGPPDALMESLLDGIADGGHGAGAIADLWAKLVSRLLGDAIHEDNRKEDEEGDGDKNLEYAKPSISASLYPKRPNRKERKKILRGHADKASPVQTEALLPGVSSTKWLSTWVPSLARALVGENGILRSASRCKQIASFCLPQIESIVGGCPTSCQFLFTHLLSEVQLQHQKHQFSSLDNCDALLWANLVVVQYSRIERYLKVTNCVDLMQAVIAAFPLDLYWEHLTHSADQIRLVAFQAMEAVAFANQAGVDAEMRMWKLALPYNYMSESKEFTPMLMKCLLKFLDRMSFHVAVARESVPSKTEWSHVMVLSQVRSFVVDFLIHDFFLRQAAYPGTTLNKESFALAILEVILLFVVQDKQANCSDNNNKLCNSIVQRRRRDSELATVDQLIKSLVNAEVFAALLGLFHSAWDTTRSEAYSCLCCIVQEAQRRNLQLPQEFAAPECMQHVRDRGLFLASSPRQREADTGARMLAFLYLVIPMGDRKSTFLDELATILRGRLLIIQHHIGNNPQGEINENDCNSFPLVHGILQAIKLILEVERNTNQKLHQTFVSLCVNALQISLIVIADVKEGEEIDGIHSDHVTQNYEGGKPHFSFSSGAIGANGTFSSVRESSNDRVTRRLAKQRVIVGSCLMAKEACNALASLLTGASAFQPGEAISSAGTVLINTLISVKHAGVAFAAHRSLQQLALTCLKFPVDGFGDHAAAARLLPADWAARLWQEIATTEKVRDSTLRRSTGYALAFLSLMRSEASMDKAQHLLCRNILSRLLQLSLPSKSYLQSYFDRMKIETPGKSELLQVTEQCAPEPATPEPVNSDNEERARVHALNILRLIILDAPLSSEVKPFAGAATATSLIGYDDPKWAVRNSSTMVFASVMLRIVDPDKNANNKDTTSRNAVTLKELFLSYPALPEFLLSVLESNIAESKNQIDGNSPSECFPLFPVLLLLSRIESIAQSGSEAAVLARPFVGGILLCLTHRHDGVRRAAARALANLRSGDDDLVELSSRALLRKCLSILDHSDTGCHEDKVGDSETEVDWNGKHGALLGIQALLDDTPAALFEDLALYKRIVHVATWCDFCYSCPPDCVSVAIEIWSSTSFRVAGRAEIKQVTECCTKLIKTISSIECTIGCSRLAGVVARVISRSLSDLIWSSRSFYGELSNSMALFREMLTTENLDVRFEFVKVFKKSIDTNINRLKFNPELHITTKSRRLRSISDALTSSLLHELRQGTESHPPTIRRLSRCLLECVYALERLNSGNEINDDEATQPPPSNLWNVSNQMVGSLFETRYDKEYCLTVGNAVELMGVALGKFLQQQTHSPSLSELLGRADVFMDLTCRLSDPQLSWRLRLSVANAVEASGLLRVTENMIASSIQLRQVQNKLNLLLFNSLQDSDADVRLAASWALQRGSCRSSTLLSRVPIYNLTLALTQLKSMANNGFAHVLFQDLLNNCAKLDANLAQAYQELPSSRPNLLNVGLERKIFEDEDPNPCCELLLTNQLLVTALMKSPESRDSSKSETKALREVEDQILEKCHLVLSSLESYFAPTNDRIHVDIIHNLTRCNAVFPALHSLVLGSICVLYHGRVDSKELRLIASQIVTATSAPSLHPLISEALKILAKEKTFGDDESGARQIGNLCFLLPKNTSNII